MANYTDTETSELYNSLDDKTRKIPKKILHILNKHDVPLTDKEEIADILVNLLHNNRVQSTLDDIKITSRNSNWFDRMGTTSTAITDGVERGQLDDELSEYADITQTPLAKRKSITYHYSGYKRKRGKGKRKKDTKKRKIKKRKSTRKK